MSNKVTAYFTRLQPFYLLSKEELGDHEAFDAYPVEVDATTIANVRSVRRLIEQMEQTFKDNPAPEECAELEAGIFEAGVRKIFKTRAQDNG